MRPSGLIRNGQRRQTPAARAFPATGSWDTWRTVTLTVPVNAGTNTVRATATTGNGGPNLDYLDLS